MKNTFDGSDVIENNILLKKLYQLEKESPTEMKIFEQKLRDSPNYSQFFEYKKRMERDIINIRQSKLFNQRPWGRVPQTLFFEILNENINTLYIFLNNDRGNFIQTEKCMASHVLVQVFDENDQLISEELKEL